MQYPIDLIKTHSTVWQQVQSIVERRHPCPQSFLFVGDTHAQVPLFVNRFMASILCEQAKSPCGMCRRCQAIIHGRDVDVQYVGLQANDKMIKIEPIRQLQQDIYQMPKRGSHRIIVIEQADKMNASSANALLKILEEPPKHVIFILIAEQINRILPTITSRCPIYRFPDPQTMAKEHSAPLSLGEYYEENSLKGELYRRCPELIADLKALCHQEKSPCEMASNWSQYEMEPLLWILYLLIAQLIQYKLTGKSESKSWQESIKGSSALFTLPCLFKQMDEINALIKKTNHNINMNQTLALENIWLGFLEASYGGQ